MILQGPSNTIRAFSFVQLQFSRFVADLEGLELHFLYLRTNPIAPFGESLCCLSPLGPLSPYRYIYNVEVFSVNISPLKKAVSRRLGRPGPRVGDLVE